MRKSIKKALETIDKSDILLKQDFGNLLLSLRKKVGWSRQELADQSFVPYKTIVDLERALDRRTVTLLADAFSLNDLERRDFFVIAGLTPEIEPKQSFWSPEIQDFYRGMRYPALVCDHLLNVHSCNTYFLALMEMDYQHAYEQFKQIVFDSAGPNLIRAIFDPVFNVRAQYGSEWEELARRNIVILRHMSQRVAKDERYYELFRELNLLPDFAELWQTTDPNAQPFQLTFSTINNSRYGKFSYLNSEAILTGLYAEQMRAAFYMVSDESSELVLEAIHQNNPKMAFEFDLNRKELNRLL